MSSHCGKGSARMGPLSVLSAALILFGTRMAVNAQSVLDPSKLPSCAFECQKLTDAESNCVPPRALATDQGTYQSCFCSSTIITTLYSTPAGLCDSVCSSSEMQDVQDWYLHLCHDGTVVTPAGSAPTGASSSAPSSSATTSGPSAATSSAGTSNQNASSSNSQESKSWISTHYGWVIFLIVLLIAIVLGLWLGLWLRRRHKRRTNAHRFSSNSHLPGPGSAASPYGSGVLSPADASFMGSRNHPQMTMVADAGSEAAFERYGGYGTPVSRAGDERDGTASPVSAIKGSRATLKSKRTHS